MSDDLHKLCTAAVSALPEPAIRKLLASPRALQRVMVEVVKSIEARQAQIAAEEQRVRQEALETACFAAVSELCKQMGRIKADIEIIKQSDAQRAYLDALNHAAHRNGCLSFDREKFENLGGVVQ